MLILKESDRLSQKDAHHMTAPMMIIQSRVLTGNPSIKITMAADQQKASQQENSLN